MSKWADPSPQLMQRYRILSGMTLAEAAEAAKTYPANICDWEKGKHKPTAKSLAKLAKAYKCDISDFYLVDIPIVKVEATSEVMGYFRNPEANIDRKASLATQLIISLPHQHQVSVTVSEAEKQVDDLLSEGDAPDYKEE